MDTVTVTVNFYPTRYQLWPIYAKNLWFTYSTLPGSS